MAQLPYYELKQGTLEKEQPMPIVDKWAPAREALGGAKKYFEQKEAVVASKLVSQARADWNVRLNAMEQEAGLDYEGFTEKVSQAMTDYENDVYSKVPVSQRDKFDADFAGIKSTIMGKAGLYEATASTERLKIDIADTADNYANAILSDPSQLAVSIEEMDDLINGLQVPNSAKEAFRKDSVNTMAIAQINSMTNKDPQTLYNTLAAGDYDPMITPKQKAAAMSQALNKIKSNHLEYLRISKENAEMMFNEDMLKVNRGEYTALDLTNLSRKYDHFQDFYNKLWSQFEKNEKRGVYINQTAVKLLDGRIDPTDKNDKTGVDMLYQSQMDMLSKDENFSALSPEQQQQAQRDVATGIISKTGYMPTEYSTTLKNALNSSDYKVAANAGDAYFEAYQVNPHMVNNLTDDDKDNLFILGAAIKSGYPVKDAVDMVRLDPTDSETKVRTSTLKKMTDKGKIEGSLDVDDASASAEFARIYEQVYLKTGNSDLAQEIGETYVNNNYSYNIIGSGEAGIFEWAGKNIDLDPDDKFSGTFRTRRVPMYQAPLQVYKPLLKGKAYDQAEELFSRDLFATVKNELKGSMLDNEIKYKDITIGNDNKNFYNGLPVYSVFYKGAPLYNKDGSQLYWRPDVKKYLEGEK